MRTCVYTTPFTLFMPQELLTRMKDAATREYQTQSEFVRKSIREKIERNRETAPVSASLLRQELNDVTATPDSKVIANGYAEIEEPLS